MSVRYLDVMTDEGKQGMSEEQEEQETPKKDTPPDTPQQNLGAAFASLIYQMSEDSKTKKVAEQTQVAALTAQLFQRMDAAIEELRGVFSAFERVDQQTLNIADKLTVLDGATIALTFSVIGLISSKFSSTHPAIQREYLYQAWWLFGSSMVACIGCQMFGLRAAMMSQVHVTSGLTEVRTQLMQSTINRLLPNGNNPVEVGVSKGRIRAITISDWLRRLSHFTLIVAQVLTVWGFMRLLSFIRANSDVLLSGGK